MRRGLYDGAEALVRSLDLEAPEAVAKWPDHLVELETRWRVTTRSKPGGAGKVESRSVGPEELRGWEVQVGSLYLGRFAR